MNNAKFDKVCYWTEQREEHVPLVHLKNGEIGFSFGCTQEGQTVQVRLPNGELDSWNRSECAQLSNDLPVT